MMRSVLGEWVWFGNPRLALFCERKLPASYPPSYAGRSPTGGIRIA